MTCIPSDLMESPCRYVPTGVRVFLLGEHSTPARAAAGLLRRTPEEPGAPPRPGSSTHFPHEEQVAGRWTTVRCLFAT